MLTRSSTPASEYYSARSSMEATAAASSSGNQIDLGVDGEIIETPTLAPLNGDGRRRQIGVSNNVKRDFKDKRIYVNLRTGLPVRPPTSFGLFKHALRRQAKDSKVDFYQFHQRAIKAWQRLSENDKATYVERAKKLADEFKKIEVPFLRKKVRDLQRQIKDIRRNFHLRPRHPPRAHAALDTDDEIDDADDDGDESEAADGDDES